MENIKKSQFDIKTCPHCGDLAGFKIRYSEPQRAYYMQVKCYRCGAQSRSVRTTDITDSTAKEEAVEAWNMRV